MNDNNRNLERSARVRRGVALLVLVGAAAAAHAQQQSAPSAAEVGHSTEALLALQRDNQAASPALPMLGDAASLAYQRYLDSFKNKIPDSMGSPLNANGGGAPGGQGAAQSSY
ncbi:DUF3613 domain-containing protein [Burkholderia sp. Ac-20353]|uniref:DUF3613 domain-containing protein n=1 Tax=Burkholderia sp. Ac-20353 TaxID=2703894 RepID=UPI00197B867F|nr:DUF3613 domain-containing protein [Burkholderia sp. Ac-20353]MBN3792774.1 DUF3613 domain-containing protein [Burkholderia sp. Ac-20353]